VVTATAGATRSQDSPSPSDDAPRRIAATADAARGPAGSSGLPTSQAYRSAGRASGPATTDNSSGTPVLSDDSWVDGQVVSEENVSRVSSWNVPTAPSTPRAAAAEPITASAARPTALRPEPPGYARRAAGPGRTSLPSARTAEAVVSSRRSSPAITDGPPAGDGTTRNRPVGHPPSGCCAARSRSSGAGVPSASARITDHASSNAVAGAGRSGSVAAGPGRPASAHTSRTIAVG
jgi:hypothetical protein